VDSPKNIKYPQRLTK